VTLAIVDSGVLYALFDRGDDWHDKSVAFFKSHAGDAVVPLTILAEVGYMVETKLKGGAPRALVEWLARGQVPLEGLLPQDLRRMSLLMSKYPEIGVVDASVAAIAERMFADTIATTDRRHFSAIRPLHVERFALLP
jgi:predicted nucleic acid-binding protein